MAVTDIEINATAAELEAAALAEKWDRKKIFEAVHPMGSILFFIADVNSDYINNMFGLTGSIWEQCVVIESGSMPIYGYRAIKKWS
jgi:hypothetical protein